LGSTLANHFQDGRAVLRAAASRMSRSSLFPHHHHADTNHPRPSFNEDLSIFLRTKLTLQALNTAERRTGEGEGIEELEGKSTQSTQQLLHVRDVRDGRSAFPIWTCPAKLSGSTAGDKYQR
jgi:hypothetical protein